MKAFAIQEKKTSKRYYSIRTLSILFSMVLILSFSVISFFAKINNRIQYESKIDIFNQNINEIAFYFWTIDANISKMLLGLDEVTRAYLNGENILKTKNKKIDDLMYYIKENNSYLQNFWFKKYAYLITILSDFWTEKEEIKVLLGKGSPQNYLVILQNTNEKRPNGGFFWSFAFVTLDKARITNLEIIDSYYPDYFAPEARVPLHPWEKQLFPLAKEWIWFIAGNKFWFTNLDGKNLKTLYEMSFNTHYDKNKLNKLINPRLHEKLLHKHIKGVIFVRLDLFTKYFPQLEKQSRERQFVNANIDLIRGKVKKDKKEKYIKEANLFFQDNWKSIFKSIINNIDEIIQQRGINIYLSNVSQNIQDNLKKHNLTTLFSSKNIYFWDTNIANNKADMFMNKHIEVYDKFKVLKWETENDILDISMLLPGEYTIKIYYTFNISPWYTQYIQNLEKQYNITMTERETSILGLSPSLYLSTNNIPRYWGTQSYIYFPKNITLKNIGHTVIQSHQISTPFAKVQKYQTFITNPHQTKVIEFKLIIPTSA